MSSWQNWGNCGLRRKEFWKNEIPGKLEYAEVWILGVRGFRETEPLVTCSRMSVAPSYVCAQLLSHV